MLIQKMKAKFLECMKYMYPEGITNQHQHRDLIRVFGMGWLECLLATNQDQVASAWLEEWSPYVDLNWWPDESWQWW